MTIIIANAAVIVSLRAYGALLYAFTAPTISADSVATAFALPVRLRVRLRESASAAPMMAAQRNCRSAAGSFE